MPKHKKKRDSFQPLQLTSPIKRSQSKRLEDEDIYDAILNIAENTKTPLKPSDIHKLLGGLDSCTIWDFRRCLFNLKDTGIMTKIGDEQWVWLDRYKDGETNELAEQSPDILQTEEPHTTNTVKEDCESRNASDRCHHVHFHHVTNNYIQVGNKNRMIIGSKCQCDLKQ